MSFGISNSSSNIILQTPGLFAYWDSERTVSPAGTVDVVFDKSSNGQPQRNLYKVGGTGPVITYDDPLYNGFPSINDSAANIRLQSTFDESLAQPATVYIVTSLNNQAATYFITTNAGNFDNSFGMSMSSAGNISMQCLNAGPALTSSSGYNDDTSHVIAAIYNTSSSSLYLDNSQTPIAQSPGDGSVSSNSAAVLTIGSFGTAMVHSWAFIAYYSGAHDQYTRFRIMSFLGRKYKISTS